MSNFKITLKDAVNPFPDFKVDHSFRIMKDAQHIGNVHVNILMDDLVHIEWIEILPVFRGKGYFRESLICLMEHFGTDKLSLESSEDNLKMYKHLDAVVTGYDDFREMTSMILHKDVLRRKI